MSSMKWGIWKKYFLWWQETELLQINVSYGVVPEVVEVHSMRLVPGSVREAQKGKNFLPQKFLLLQIEDVDLRLAKTYNESTI